jgi:Leucine-rich repeat (LRR) protein
MNIYIKEQREYDTGIHPEIIGIMIYRDDIEEFFKCDRFPNLDVIRIYNCGTKYIKINCPSLQRLYCIGGVVKLKLNCPLLIELDCSECQITELILDQPYLQKLWCFVNRIRKLELNCPSLIDLRCTNNKITKLKLCCPILKKIECYDNRITSLDLDCPSLEILQCHANPLTNLNGLEFCEKLKRLDCSPNLRDSVKILRKFIPGLSVRYY